MMNRKTRAGAVAAPPTLPDGRSLKTYIIAGLEGTVGLLDDALAALAALFSYNDVRRGELELVAGGCGGRVLFEPIGGFDKAQIGAPLIVTQAPGMHPDEAQFGIVLFVAQVLNTRQMQIEWFCATGAPRTVRINYILGSLVS